MGDAGEWEPDAENWVRWARTPEHDAYWYYRDSFFDTMVPPAGKQTIEVGCGEGRVTRDLMARGHRVAAIDSSQSLVRYARNDDGRGRYAVADSATLPFQDGRFDLAVAYNSLQVVADMAATVCEIARVLRRYGRLCVCIAHPVTDLGRFDSREADARFTLRSGYFDNVRVEETVENNGLKMTFRGWTYSLEDYSRAMEDAGLRIEAIREPKPADSSGRYDRWLALPQFMFIRAMKP
jgi:ubiquinone/menaquinone biosynthesis C-methylase UbiE